jgi:hypothetical protein
MSKVKNCKYVNNNAVVCEADKSVTIGVNPWVLNYMYAGLFIYHSVDVTHQLELSDITVAQADLQPSIELLANGTLDIHAGLWTPLQSEFYCDKVGRDISIKKLFVKGDKTLLIRNANSSIRASDLGTTNVTIYSVSEDAGDITALRNFISEAGLDESTFTFRVANEAEIYRRVRQDGGNTLGLVWRTSSRYNTTDYQPLDVASVFGEDFVESNVCPAVSSSFNKSYLYKQVKDSVNNLRLTTDLLNDLEDKFASLTDISTASLYQVVKDYQSRKGYTVKQLGDKITQY